MVPVSFVSEQRPLVLTVYSKSVVWVMETLGLPAIVILLLFELYV